MERIQKYIVCDGLGEGILIIDEGGSMTMPFFCPLCEFIMNNRDDFSAYSRFNCCTECEMTFAQPNRDMWDSGWRPDEKVLNSYKERIMNKSLNLFLDEEDN